MPRSSRQVLRPEAAGAQGHGDLFQREIVSKYRSMIGKHKPPRSSEIEVSRDSKSIEANHGPFVPRTSPKREESETDGTSQEIVRGWKGHVRGLPSQYDTQQSCTRLFGPRCCRSSSAAYSGPIGLPSWGGTEFQGVVRAAAFAPTNPGGNGRGSPGVPLMAGFLGGMGNRQSDVDRG